MRWRTVAALAVLLAVLWPANARGQESPDANCPGPREFSFASMQGGNARFAQTFTSGFTGGITTAQVEITKQGTPGDYQLQINEADGAGAPTNTVLASTTIPDSSVPAGDGLITGTFADPAEVVAGAQYAIIVTRPGSSGLRIGTRDGDDCPGRLFHSGSQVAAFGPLDPYDLIFAVFVTLPDLSPPEATITQGPKDKTRKKRARFEFSGTDSRVVTSFQCSLDGAAFAPCASPQTMKVKRGKHTFHVRAVDQAGNVGAPVSDSWKVKKKKRK
jgi:hypothetical protein